MLLKQRARRDGILLSAASALALVAGAAQAQTSELSGIEVQAGRLGAASLNLTQPSDAGSRLGLAPIDTPASVQVISGDLIRQRGDVSLLEAETRATGITAVPSPGNGNNALVARGFSGVGSVMQLYDGVQLFVGSGTVSFPFEPWTVDRVEVLSGPNSVLYGAGAIGGTINVVPRRPDPINRSYEVKVGGGSFNTYRLDGDATGPINDKLSYRADIAYNHSDGWLDRGGRSETIAITGALRWDLSPTLKLVLSDDYGKQNPMDYYGDPLINGDLDTRLRTVNYNVVDAIQTYQDNWLQLKAEWTPFSDWSFRNDLYLLNTDRHWNNSENFAYQTTSKLLLRNGYLEIYHHEAQYGDHADGVWKTHVAGHENDLSFGFEVNHVQFQNVSNSPFPGTSSIDPFHYTPDTFIHAAATTPVVKTTTDQHAVFAEDRFEVFKGLNLVTGLRADHYDLTRLDQRANTSSTHRYDTVSWRAGLVQSLPYNTSVYVQYAFATDPVSSLITLSPAQQIFDLTTGRQVEVGAKQALGGWAEWTLAAYQIVKNNLLQPVPGNPTLQQQIGQQSSRGIEASFAVTPMTGLRLEANATVLRAKFDSFGETVGGVVISRAGARPPNVPEKTANAFATWDVWGPIQIRGEVRAVDKRYGNNANTLFLPGYAEWDFGAKYQLNPRMSLNLNLYNAFDRVYPISSYNGGAQWILGDPRAIEVSFHGRF